jgi:hypothetical protein
VTPRITQSVNDAEPAVLEAYVLSRHALITK